MAVAPNSINYGDQLPLGIEAKSQRRLFFPATGDSYTGSSNAIIRFNINYDGMLDTSQSYLKFKLTAPTEVGKGMVRDLGQPEIARLVVSSGGVVLEDIINYNSLVGGILAPAQYGDNQMCEANHNLQLFHGRSAGEISTTTAGFAVSTFENGNLIGNLLSSEIDISSTRDDEIDSANPTIETGKSHTFTYKLYSGLLDNEKYLPLVLMNNGLDIELHLASPNDIGLSNFTTPEYTISEIRYVAHLIDLQRDFYDMLRMTQQQSGGVLQIAGTTFRNFTNNVDASVSGAQTYNIPVRARSIKSVLFRFAPRNNTKTEYNLSYSSHGNVSAYQVQIGATRFPPTQIQSHPLTNKSEPYFELMKSFGKLGSTIHQNLLRGTNYLNAATGDLAEAEGGTLVGFSPYGIDLETFRAEIENGIDTSSRALPMSLLVQHDAGQNLGTTDMTLHTFVMIDSLFFINMDGSVSVSS